MTRALPLVVLAALVLPRILVAQDPVEETGSVAPADCWYVRGGNAARSGETRTRGVGGTLETAWSTKLTGTIEGEPLVWGDHVVVCTRDAKGTERTLHVLRLGDGKKRLPPKKFKTTAPLAPSLWRDLVVVRAAPDTLQVFRIGYRILDPRWKYDAGGPVSEPLLFEDELYVRVSRVEIRRLQIGRTDPVWSQSGRYCGNLSLRGDHVYCVRYDGEGSARLALLARRDGSLADGVDVGHHDGRVPDEDAETLVTVLRKHCLVRHALPVPTADGGTANTVMVDRRWTPARVALSPSGLMEFYAPAGGLDGDWIGLAKLEGGPQLVRTFSKDGKEAFQILADRNKHKPFVTHLLPPSRAGSTVYMGNRAFDTKTLAIRWAGSDEVLVRPVPARETLLVVDRSDRLSALRRPSAGAGAVGRVTGEAASTIARATAVLDDGTISRGSLDYDPKAGTLKKDRTRHALDDVLLLVAGDGRVVHATDAVGARRGFGMLGREKCAAEYARLANEACAAADLELADRLLDHARESGATAKELKKPAARLASLQRKPRPKNADLAEQVAAKVRAVPQAPSALYWSAIAGLEDPKNLDLRLDLLRDLLALDPQHAEATRLVKELSPDKVTPPSTDLAGWIDFIEAASKTHIAFVEQPDPKRRDLTHSQRELGATQFTWRKDLVGIESDSLLILTPLATPGRIASCLSMGELVCRSLDEIFAGAGSQRDRRLPLKLHLYETKDEYLAESTKGVSGFGKKSAKSFEWTAGHYSPRENVSRIYLPAEADAFQEMMNTYAHEIVHHWIAERCPLFSTAQRNDRAGGVAGYWIVEGFATFVEEGTFDLRGRKYDAFSARAKSLDTVANAEPRQLMDWKLLFGFSQRHFANLKTTPSQVIPLRWYLGFAQQVSEKHLFYMQAAAACQYLYHAENGRHRPALLAYIGKHYSGQTTPNTAQELFGLDAEALGAKIVAWAKETVR